jgi:hypothetical protein
MKSIDHRSKKRKMSSKSEDSEASATGFTVQNSVIGGSNYQAQGNIYVGAFPEALAGEVGDEASALMAMVRRQQRRNHSARPAFMARHAGSQQLVDLLGSGASRQIIVVHGQAGVGKSCVTIDAVDMLAAHGWAAALVRMDALTQVTNSAADLGAAMHLGGSPVDVIKRSDSTKGRLLVVDQLDAISEYSGRMPDSYDAVLEMLEQAKSVDDLKIVLVVRTIDLKSDPRMRSLLQDGERVQSLEIGLLAPGDVSGALRDAGVDVETVSLETLELLRLPLHLKIFMQLDARSHLLSYATRIDLYEQYTKEIRLKVELSFPTVAFSAILSAVVTFMSENEALQAPNAVLDSFPQREVLALVSAGILIEELNTVALFHETYFDFQFARAFVAQGRNLRTFLIDSGQQLFRRAQTRQVLEYLAANNRMKFHREIVELLESQDVRAHLLDVAVQVLYQLDANSADWGAIEAVALGNSRRSSRLISLLSKPAWFDAVDEAKRWPSLLLLGNDAVANQMIMAARQRPARVAELCVPHVGESDVWNSRLRSIIQWSISRDLTDLAVQLMEQGILDDLKGPIAVNDDIWSIVHHLADDDAASAARFIGAYLRRGLVLAQEQGVSDPFEGGIIEESSAAGGGNTILEVAAAEPEEFLLEVLPFISGVIELASNGDEVPGSLIRYPRWSYRYVSETPSIDDALLSGAVSAVRLISAKLMEQRADLIQSLATSYFEPLRFLACTLYAAAAENQMVNEAIDWLLSDIDNLSLGWADSPRWASRELIRIATRDCDDLRLSRLCDVLLEYYSDWERTPEGRRAHGLSQYELLSAIPSDRLLPNCVRRLAELERKFSSRSPKPPSEIEAGFVGSPVPEEAAAFMADDDWRRAIEAYFQEEPQHNGFHLKGGAFELAQMMGRAAAKEPERFTDLALSLDSTAHSSYVVAILDAVSESLSAERLTILCVHASEVAGSDAGRAVCQAIRKNASLVSDDLVQLLEQYANDPDPTYEAAFTPSHSGKPYFNGDIHTAGMNCVRGQAAESVGFVIFEQSRYVEQLMSTIEALVADPVIAVRAQAAIPVSVLINTHAEEALQVAEALFFQTSNVILSAAPALRLFNMVHLNSPERFAPYLADALNGNSEEISELAGQVWAAALLRGSLTSSVPADVSELEAPARKGAATVLSESGTNGLDVLVTLFNDTDIEVRSQAARVLWHLEEFNADDLQRLVAAFAKSDAFMSAYEHLLRSLDQRNALVPEAALDVCGRAVDVAGADLGNFQTSAVMAGKHIVSIVLDLYRQGGPVIRSRCLDLVDRLADYGALGLEEALENEPR